MRIVNIGQADFFTAVKRDIDFSWIYYGWTGIEAELRKVSLDVIYLKNLDPVLDFYTRLSSQRRNDPERPGDHQKISCGGEKGI